jgi:hypothetical protein
VLCPFGVVPVSTLEPVESELPGDRLGRQSAVLRIVARELMLSLSETAGRMAETVDEVVRIHEGIAGLGISAVAAQALEHAEHARRFAARERAEQQRWAARAEDD